MSLTGDNSCAELLAQLRAVVGKAHVLAIIRPHGAFAKATAQVKATCWPWCAPAR